LLALGAVQYSKPFKGAEYGVVMKCGDKEAFAVEQQPVEVPPKKPEPYVNMRMYFIVLGKGILFEPFSKDEERSLPTNASSPDPH
jgi:hypothetical protein